jgi:4-amino-4-deoxy-L-arabinose transferase-like glycosyltransferase
LTAEPSAAGAPRRPALLFAASLVLATANIHTLSLPAIDDCFYARKGVEMARQPSFTVTWGGTPNFQNPPLQFWILALSYRLLGENDLAARLPSALMAVGTLIATYAIGARTLGHGAAAAGTALLSLSPYFQNQARRCMLDLPLAFWTTLAVLAFVEGLARPRRHLLVALPLGAALLTKSVLGLVALLPCAATLLVFPPARAALLRPWLWLGAAGGLALGASWPFMQWLEHGPSALEAQFLGEVLRRASAEADPRGSWLDYPKVLLESYQPVILPALFGAAALWRAWRHDRAPGMPLLLSWAFGPALLYSLSSARAPRYLFPSFPALALCGGFLLARALPRLARTLPGWPAAVPLLGAAVVFWVRPSLLTLEGTAPFKRNKEVLQARIAAAEALPYLGERYWERANPLLYYADRRLAPPAVSAWPAAAQAASGSGLVLVERARLGELARIRPPREVVLENGDWSLVSLRRRRP